MTAAAAPGRFSAHQLDDIRARELVSAVFDRLGQKLRRTGRKFECLCPFHAERTPSCQIDDAKGVFHCKGCGEGGNIFDAVMKLRACSFPEAVEFLGGARDLTDLDVARIEKRQRDADAEARVERQRTAAKVERMWAATGPLTGTHAQAYLEARGLHAPATPDLRFTAALEYWGYPDAEEQEVRLLGEFPAMVGAIRSTAGTIIGLHRTYLDPVEPAKLKPPGDRERNRAKKITGGQRGGSIALSKPAARMAYGEGIETTLSWSVLVGGEIENLGLAALVSLGNICGGATGTLDHPERKHPDGRPILIPNGEPDLDRPGFLPGPDVEEIYLLGDGDSDPVGTRYRLMTAVRRWRRDPPRDVPLTIGVSMAPDGLDFNDVLQREAEAV
ncbi:DUF7146 domain-containing protein [Methylobacterium fujisawaense]|uniref:DUF7146 domain-containing protein n=1 Tax=Methylobacterium fujisawaense TaxID=107400 RepID=UPI002F35B282